jgi:adenylate cyclase, class 2
MPMTPTDHASGPRLLAELKARCGDLARVRERLRPRATYEATRRQVDTYFSVQRGRLKLREVAGRPAELIYYERSDLAAVKPSRVYLASTEDPSALGALLGALLGIRARVTKTREIWRWEGVQVHLDQVEGLGSFVELEEMVDAPQGLGKALDHLGQLQADLDIGADDLVDRSYGELA